MTVRYTKQTQKSGASIGTVTSVAKPKTWTNSTNIDVEGSNWNIEALYPGWLPCDGRTLNVSDYYALYQVIGNTYGGTTNLTFKLPDYRSKKLMGTGVVDGNKGSGPSLTPNLSPTGTAGGTIDLPGSQGGMYKITTVRQLPPSSEITPGAPGAPAVIGGDATDAFGLGKFSTSGFSDTTLEIQPNFSGNASWSAGTSGSGTATKVITSAPLHTHEVKHVIRDSSPASSGQPYAGNKDLPFNNITAGSLLTYNRSDQPIRSHSHYVGWGSLPPVSSFGNDNNAGNGLFNALQSGAGVHSSFYGNFSSNLGEVINKTIDLVNEGGINMNSGTFTLSNNSKTVFDNALSVRLEAAEEIVMMTPYFRLRYIIKAY